MGRFGFNSGTRVSGDFFRTARSAAGMLVVGTLFLVIAPAQTVYADDYHYQNILIGERAAGMGGAFTAIANDASAVYYNPAGLALVSDSSLSVSANLYGVTSGTFENAYGAGNNLSYNTVHVIPSTFGGVKKLDDDSALGFGAFVTDSLAYKDNTKALIGGTVNAVVESVYSEETLQVGASYARRMGANWYLGVSLFYVNRSMNSLNSFLLTSGSPATISDSAQSIDYSHASLFARVGTLYRPSERLMLGLTVSTPSVKLSGKGYIYDRDSTAGVNINRDDLATGGGVPWNMRAGVAYRQSESLTFAADFSYFTANRFSLFPEYGAGTEVVTKEVYNLNAGMEYRYGNMPIRAGIYTNNSASAGYGQATWDYLDVNMIGFAFSVGHEDEHTTFNAGLNYLGGSGSATGYDQNLNPTPAPAKEGRLYVFIGSSYFF